ncbi:hypothetical protein LLH00_11045 [bacterium]|nr:hypothetical protein [bacterium]
MLVSTVLIVFLALLVRRRGRVRGSLFFLLMSLGVTGWAVTSTFEYVSMALAAKIWWSKLSYVFIGSVGGLWLHFVLDYTDRRHWLSGWRLPAFWAIPAVCLVLALTNESHRLIWSSVSLISDQYGSRALYEHGPACWALAIFTYIVLTGAALHLIHWSGDAPAMFRRQARTLVLGSLPPFAGSLAYMFKLTELPGVDYTLFGFALMALIVGWSLLRQGLLEVPPVVYDKLFSMLRSGVLVTDTEGRLILSNPAALSYLGLGALQPGAALPQEACSILSGCGAGGGEVCLRAGAEELWIDISCSPLEHRDSSPAGRLYILRNITEQKQREREKERMIAALEKSLSEIKRLQGLLPICMHCKKVRNDKGYWEHVELYVSEHSEAVFSHGVCPDCLEKFYGQYLKK